MRIVFTLVSFAAISLAPVAVLAQDAPPAPAAAPAPAPMPTNDQPSAQPTGQPTAAPPQLTIPPGWILEPQHEPLAGYANGGFFLRDPHDWFVLFPKGRLQIDWYNFLNRGATPPGVDSNASKDPRPKGGVFVRRARVELQGTMFRHFDFHIAGEYASTPATGSFGTVADAYMVVNYLPWLQAEIGQFDAPFTMENRTSDKYFDFMERSIVVRSWGIPSNKEIGAFIFGWVPMHLAYYSFGVVDGNGQNFKLQDNYPALVGRAIVTPLSPFLGKRFRWADDVWVGGSFWWKKNSNIGGFVTPNATGAAQNDIAGMSTQGGFGFFSSNYNDGKDAMGNTLRAHLVPNGDNIKWAVEANIPVWKLGLRFEAVGQTMDLAQYFDANPTAATMTRSKAWLGTAPGHGGEANLNGIGYYLELYGWILGDVNYLETPGQEATPHIKKFAAAHEPTWGLMVAAKYEHVDFNVIRLQGALQGGSGAFTADPGEGNYSIDAFELGVNAWASKHVRLTANYVLNYIGGTAPNVKGNFFYHNAEHELLFRIATAL